MKFIIIPLSLLFLLVLAVPVFATSMTVSECKMTKQDQYASKQQVYEIKLTLETDGTDQDEFNLSSHCDINSVMRVIAGGQFWDVVTDQGTTAPDTYTVTFDSEKGGDLLSVTTTSTSKAEHWPADADLNYFPPIWDLQIDFGDVGDSGDDIILYIRIAR